MDIIIPPSLIYLYLPNTKPAMHIHRWLLGIVSIANLLKRRIGLATLYLRRVCDASTGSHLHQTSGKEGSTQVPANVVLWHSMRKTISCISNQAADDVAISHHYHFSFLLISRNYSAYPRIQVRKQSKMGVPPPSPAVSQGKASLHSQKLRFCTTLHVVVTIQELCSWIVTISL